jgi:hypothetical protein
MSRLREVALGSIIFVEKVVPPGKREIGKEERRCVGW